MSKEIIIDWLQFTVQNKTFVGVITDILQLQFQLFEELPKGKLGYKKQLFFENISILYDGTQDMGVHIILSGKGCRFYEQYDSLINLIDRINKIEGKLTRIDLALDDKKGDLIPFEKMLSDITKGNVSSKWKTSTELIQRDMEGSKIGQTINVGSRTSNTFLRIYNKALEQKIEGTWNRIELEIKKTNAEELQKIITIDNVGTLFKGILKNYIRLLEPNKRDKNKSRWKTRKYWDNLIENVEKIKLTRKAEEKSIDEKKMWLEKQVGQTLAVISLADGSVDFVYDLIKDNAKKLKLKNQKILERHKIIEEERKNGK